MTIYKAGKHEFVFAFYFHVDLVFFLYFRSFADIGYLVALDDHCSISQYFASFIHRYDGGVRQRNIFHRIDLWKVSVVLFNPFAK
jgi:hypothetical protein